MVRPGVQLSVVTVVAALLLGWQTWRHGDFVGLWMTPDQQAQREYGQLEFQRAAELFEDPAWKGVAAFRSGLYEEAAASFGRIPSAVGFYNRGNALMRSREYAMAITAYEQAVAEDPAWVEAQDNLRLSRYVLEYINRARDGTGTEIGADDYVFDNTGDQGTETVITQDSIVEMQTAEKWMRSVDTETADFLRSRFLLESVRSESP